MKQKEIKIKISDFVKLYNDSKIELFFKGHKGEVIERKSYWSIEDRSLLIHSITKGMFVNPIYLSIDNDSYSVIDGKQRILSIVNFVNNQYAISGDLFDNNGCSLKGKAFFQLTPSLQHKILNHTLTIIEQEGSTQENIDTFIRCNNGVSVKPIEIFRAKMGEQLSLLKEVCSHKFFSLLELGKSDSYRNYEMALYLLMLECNPGIGLAKKEKEDFVDSLSYTRKINPIIRANLICKLDYLFKAFYNSAYSSLENKDKYLKKSHVLIIYKFVDTAIEKELSPSEFFKWCNDFFYLNKNSRSIYWVESSRGSTTAKSSMDIRYEELKYNFDNYFGSEINRTLYIVK